ncbi:P-loop containing nucleoside triphosphate hydrolase protein [Spinellus fusiger]|nr:P-loop containing nucleoside triphosphate hydrolase protein [Spinellus fusiger]
MAAPSPTSPGFHTRLPQPQSTAQLDTHRLASRTRRPSILSNVPNANKLALLELQDRPLRQRTVSDVGKIESAALQRSRLQERKTEVRRSLLIEKQEAQQREEEESDEDEVEKRYRASAPLLDVYGVPISGGIKARASMGALKSNHAHIMPPSDLNQKIRVCVRKRPMSKKEIEKSEKDIAPSLGTRSIQINEPKLKLDLTRYIEQHTFTFDDVFDTDASNTNVYERTALPLVKYIFQGGKATCFAYGQTGSGKTFTMLDPRYGLYVLAAKDIFAMLRKPEGEHLSAWIGLYEIYQGHLYDLLNERKKLFAREDGKQNVIISGLREYPIDNVSKLIQVFEYGSSVRSTGSTGANDSSSRSHAVLQILLKPKGNRKKIHGKLSFIDLAGSERGADRGETDTKTRMEGAEINKSLLALKECIRALDQDKRHTPFRQSKLTQVLKDSFVGNSRTCMIATISPGGSNSEHTLNTLRYADRVKELKGERDRGGQAERSVDAKAKSGHDPWALDETQEEPQPEPEEEEEEDKYMGIDSNEEYYSNDDSDILDEDTFNIEEENIFDVDFPHEQDALIRSSAFASPSHKLPEAHYSSFSQQYTMNQNHSIHLGPPSNIVSSRANQWNTSPQPSQFTRPLPNRPLSSAGLSGTTGLPASYHPSPRMTHKETADMGGPSSPHLTSPPPATVTVPTTPLSAHGLPQFDYMHMDEFVKFHRAEIREITDCTKIESKLVATISLELSSQQDHGEEDSSLPPPSSTEVLHRHIKSSHHFQKYLLDLDEILERKMAAVEALRDRISETVSLVEL